MVVLAAVPIRIIVQVGYVLLVVGSIVFTYGALSALRRVRGRHPDGFGRRERVGFLIAGFVLMGGFGVALLATLLK